MPKASRRLAHAAVIALALTAAAVAAVGPWGGLFLVLFVPLGLMVAY